MCAYLFNKIVEQFKEGEAGEAQALELRKMDPTAIYKSVRSECDL